MALKPCRECGAQVSDTAEICPHCGVQAPAGAPSTSARAPRKRMGCAGILLGLIVLVIVIAKLPETPLSPEEQARKAAEDKRIEESNKKRFDTLQSATSAAMLFDPYLKYEFGTFHALDLTLSTLNAATASAVANRLCSTYHLSGGLRVFLADGHLAAQCDFSPDIGQAQVLEKATKESYEADLAKMGLKPGDIDRSSGCIIPHHIWRPDGTLDPGPWQEMQAYANCVAASDAKKKSAQPK